MSHRSYLCLRQYQSYYPKYQFDSSTSAIPSMCLLAPKYSFAIIRFDQVSSDLMLQPILSPQHFWHLPTPTTL